MRNCFLMIIFLFLCLVSCKSSHTKIGDKNVNYIPYYLKVYEADSLFIEKEYKDSYKILDSLHEAHGLINIKNYNEYLTYIKNKIVLKSTINDIEFIKIFSYGIPIEYVTNDSILSIHFNKKSNLYQKIYIEKREKFLSNINYKLRDKIVKMKYNDQLYRKNSGYQKNKHLQDSIDLTNQNELILIFEKYGFPNEKIIGDYDIDNSDVSITGILLHTKDSIRKDLFLPKILEFVKEGKADPLVYASLMDQLMLYNGQAQIYGTYENSETEIKVNEKRRQIGLPVLGYEKWRAKKLYPEFF